MSKVWKEVQKQPSFVKISVNLAQE